jgi:predicted MFS family arabinose efflux permease
MGKVMAAFSAASVLGVPMGIFLANYWDWHFPFFFLAALGLPVWILIVKNIPNLTGHLTERKNKPLQTLRGIFEVRNHWKALFFGFILMLGHFSIIPFISPYMVSNVGFSEKQLTWIYFVGGLLTLFTSPLVGKLADKYGRFQMYAVFAAICCLPIFLITNLGPTPIWQALIVSGLFFIATGGRMVPMQAMVSAAVNPKIRGSFMTLNASVQQLTAGLASLIASQVISEKVVDGHVYLVHYDWVGYGAIIFSLLGIGVASQLKTVPQTIVQVE